MVILPRRENGVRTGSPPQDDKRSDRDVVWLILVLCESQRTASPWACRDVKRMKGAAARLREQSHRG